MESQCENNYLMNLQDEDGILYKCFLPKEDYDTILKGDYELANQYLQKEIEKKNRLLAFQLLKEQQNGMTKKVTCVDTASVSIHEHKSNSSMDVMNTNDTMNLSDTEGSAGTLNNNENSQLLSPQSGNELWSYDAILALIASMGTHYDDLNHPKKKKHVFSHISNDLLSKKFIYSEKACYNKWRSLLRSYKVTKDKKGTTGQGATRFMFFDQLDELLGDKPSNNFGNTIESHDDPGSSTVADVKNTDQNMSRAEDNKKRKRKVAIEMKETSKQKRHEERMEMEDKKLKFEERKLLLLQKFIEKI